MLKLAVIYGGMSTEHDVSMVSGKNVIDNLDREKYEIYPVEITKEGIWKREGKDAAVPAVHSGAGMGLH